ncbi:hypothetical protein HNR19_001279 [Nocardioides thalensis]|uniref:DUF4190 domain-containing protein n=1 Tax=Nocardioides thalensis TaxID=1914755 RepID=A0A853C052_9ACTN|nr:hypothetical protein [Nocardioides thalensis]
MSNPYGPPGGDQNPYGQQQPQYGAPQYGAPGGGQYGAPGGGQAFGSEPTKTDGLSIAAFVSSLVCCSPVAIVLGFIGLSRTKNGQRKGRWAAVLGLVLGIIGLLAGAAVIVFVVILGNTLVTPGNAEVGQCVNIDEEDNTVTMTKKECTEEHDGEIVATTTVDDDNRADITEQMSLFCQTLIDEEDMATLNEHPDLEYNAVLEDPDNVENGDHLVCYVESEEKLTEPLL